MPGPRTPKDVIDNAIKENGSAAFFCYVLICVFVAAGLFSLVWGAINKEGLVSLAGSIAAGLFWPALNQARQIRELNLSIRLLEIPLSRADNAKEAADTLRVVFLDRFKAREPQ